MTSVFTADVTEFSLVPDKYSTSHTGVDAELTVHINFDWQPVIKHWWEGTSIDSYDVSTHTYTTSAGTAPTDTDLLSAFIDNATASIRDTTSFATDGQSAFESAAQQMVHEIGTHSGFYDGTGEDGSGNAIDTQLANVFTAIAAATGDRNVLTIDTNKVNSDLGKYDDGNAGGAAIGQSNVPVSNNGSATGRARVTTFLGELLNAHAFAAVLERLISGANFTIGDTDEERADSDSTSGTHHYQYGFATGSTGDAQIGSDAKLVFPIRITVGESQTEPGVSTSNTHDQEAGDAGTSSITFHLNLSFQKDTTHEHDADLTDGEHDIDA